MSFDKLEEIRKRTVERNLILLRYSIVVLLAVAGSSIGSDVRGQENETDPLAGVKCIVAGDNAASTEFAVDYLEGKAYFCCDKCKKSFEKNHEEFLVKANHQLVVTGQYVQKACPITGNEGINSAKVSVGGVEVGVCCDRCQGSLEAASDLASKAKIVFGKSAFKKGFEKAIGLDGISCPVDGDEVSEEFVTEYMGAKIYFCCKDCAGTFAKDTQKFATLANHQLAATGQFVQKNCPFSGAPCKKEFHAKVGSVEVGFCCGKCKAKVAGSDDGQEQIEMVFKPSVFKQCFMAKE